MRVKISNDKIIYAKISDGQFYDGEKVLLILMTNKE
jgi:hypothetical protein